MFELRDPIIDDLIFAMEDQDKAMLVDLESGALARGAEHDNQDERFVAPPAWDSKDGFALMEDFTATLRHPAARRELGLALAKGRGVFKIFKATLAAYPEAERAFRDFKARRMRAVIREWYDEHRQARGLSALGPEPEELDELVASDFIVELAPLDATRGLLDALIDMAAEEAVASLPETVVAFALGELRSAIESRADGLCAFIEDGAGGAIAAALAFREAVGERMLGRLVFVAVLKEFRGQGLGLALLEKIKRQLSAEGLHTIMLDCALLPAEFQAALLNRGALSLGSRLLVPQA